MYTTPGRNRKAFVDFADDARDSAERGFIGLRDKLYMEHSGKRYGL